MFVLHKSGLKREGRKATIITNDSLHFDEKIGGTIDRDLVISLKILLIVQFTINVNAN